MQEEIVVGTVRAKVGKRHLVVRRDGSVVEVTFEGNARPLVGADVVGLVRHDNSGESVMALRRSVLEIFMERKTTITPMGTKPELTARMLAKFLARSKSATIAPGAGISLIRNPVSEDPDLAWAMSTFQPESERLETALNVIDVRAVARSEWKVTALRDLTLPADIEGSRRSVRDLMRLLRSGFHPACCRMIEPHTGKHEVSVNFILPYSPFIGSLGFAREIAHMDRGVFPRIQMSLQDSRRISAAHNVALALAHKALGAGSGIQVDIDGSPRAQHLAKCFADAAAAMAFIGNGGDKAIIEEYADLREASLHYGFQKGVGALRDGVLEDATHAALRAAVKVMAAANPPQTAREIVASAVRIARRHALPASRFAAQPTVNEHEAASAQKAATRIGYDLRDADHETLREAMHVYRDELGMLVDEQKGNDAAGARLATFASVHVPLRMDRIFEREAAFLPPADALSGPSALAAKMNRSVRERLRTAMLDEDAIEFADPAPY